MDWHLLFPDMETALDSLPEKRPIKKMVEEKWVCLVRNGDRVFAFDETCPHEGASLMQGECTDDCEIICPRHRFKFNLNTGRGEGYYLPVYPVKKTEKGVFIGMEKKKWGLF